MRYTWLSMQSTYCYIIIIVGRPHTNQADRIINQHLEQFTVYYKSNYKQQWPLRILSLIQAVCLILIIIRTMLLTPQITAFFKYIFLIWIAQIAQKR